MYETIWQPDLIGLVGRPADVHPSGRYEAHLPKSLNEKYMPSAITNLTF